ncbi:YwqG family protein [Paenisporosarcina indica]|uniref:YwqG family protein n=1 Tax=Paenisporosarcina indica TaxID=650093 RepID=UPI00094F7CD2|nr:YwqG family protein [Paenisporosarcina indica]
MHTFNSIVEDYNLLHKKQDILKIAASSIGILKEKTDDKNIQIGGSKFGGLPDLPPSFSFPQYHNGPLSFLAQLNLKDLTFSETDDLLPKTGMLYFFYDVVNQPWGFEKEDSDSYKVLYFDGDLDDLSRTSYPQITEDYYPLPSHKVEFTKMLTFPEDPVGLELDESELDDYFEFREAIMQPRKTDNTHQELDEESAIPKHYLLGEPFNIQNNVLEDVIYYENDEKIEWNSAEMDSKRKKMTLLFQMDSDEDLDVMWGDVGMLYFCIYKTDLIKKQFDQVKFILQCY